MSKEVDQLTSNWFTSTRLERIPDMVRETRTRRNMIDYGTLGVDTANAWARISTMTRQAGGVRRAVAVHHALGPAGAGVRVADVGRDAGTVDRAVVHAALSIFAARRRIAQVFRD